MKVELKNVDDMIVRETPKVEDSIAEKIDREHPIFHELEEIKKLAEAKEKELEEVINKEKRPKKVKKAFLKSSKFIDRMKNKISNQPMPVEKELDEPLLILMKENGYTDIIEGVKAGEFVIKTPKQEKSIYLTPDKLTTIKYGENYYKCWIAYENCMSPYPEDPIHNAEMFRKTTQKLAMNWRDRDDISIMNTKTKMWLYIIGGVVIAVVLLLSTDF